MDILKIVSDALAPTPSCTPPFWAPEGHLQTIISSLIPTPKLPQGEVHLLPLENQNEKLHVTYLKGHSNICLYLFHGLGGSIDSPYMKRFAHLAHSMGHHVYLTNHRGCGDGRGLASSGYNSGRSEDLSRVIALGRSQYSHATHLAIGVSLSANALLLLSAGVRATAQPDLAIAINAPIDLEKSALKLMSGLNRIYDRHFLKSLKNYLLHNNENALKDFYLLNSLHDFDDAITAPIAGYHSREEYYQKCSAKQFLPSITVPTLIITAEDDPFVDVSDYRDAKYSKHTIVRIEKTGGHIGYLQSQGMGYKFWLDELVRKILVEIKKAQ